jgi:hypothetical protein
MGLDGKVSDYFSMDYFIVLQGVAQGGAFLVLLF